MGKGVETFNTKKSAVGGMTPLNVAVRVAARQLEKGTDAKQLYIITDGFPMFHRREDEAYGTLSLMLWTRDEIHKARSRGIAVTGVIIGDDLSDHMVSLIFGPRRYWKRITVEETGEMDDDGEPVVRAERLGSELVTLLSGGFIDYLKRG
jgi:nitric oxide reductase activation protein